MAIATKRQLGAAVTWGGIWHIPHLGIHVIPPDKVSRASSALLRVEQKDALVTWREYRSLSGLLEHLNPWSNGMRDDFHGWYEIHAHAERNDLGPTDWIGYLITQEPEYRELKERCAAAAVRGEFPEGVATIEIAIEALKLAEYLTPLLSARLG